MLKGLWQGVLFGRECKKKASESKGSETLFPRFRWWLYSAATTNSIRRYSTAPEREFRSQFPLFPLSD